MMDCRLGGGATPDRMAEAFELRRGLVEMELLLDFEAHDLVARIALEIAERVLALVRLEIDRALGALGDVEAEIFGGEMGRAFEIAGPEPDIGDIGKLDHGSLLAAGSKPAKTLH